MSQLIIIAITGIVLLLSGFILFRKRQSKTHLVLSLLLMGMGILLLLAGWGLYLMAVEDAAA